MTMPQFAVSSAVAASTAAVPLPATEAVSGWAMLLPLGDPVIMMFVMAIFLVAGFIKGFLGIGLPAAAVALLTLLMAPAQAIALMPLPIIATNFVQFVTAKNRLETSRRYWLCALFIIISLFFTSSFLNSYPTALLVVAIGGAMVVFALTSLFGFSLVIGPSRLWQVVFGIISGVLGGLSSIWSPTVTMFLLARRVEKEDFIAATGFLFLSGSFPLIGGLIIAEVLTLEAALQSLVGLCCAMIGFRLGAVMRGRVGQALFRRIVLWVFLIMGTRLIINGLF